MNFFYFLSLGVTCLVVLQDLNAGKFFKLLDLDRDFLDLFIIVLCALKILPDSKYPHYNFYSIEDNKYILDPRTIQTGQEVSISSTLKKILNKK